MKIEKLVQDWRSLNKFLWTLMRRADISTEDVLVSRIVRSSLRQVEVPVGFEFLPFGVSCTDPEEMVSALHQAVSQVGLDGFNGSWQAKNDTGETQFARAFWRFCLKVAKTEPAICMVLSGLPKRAVKVLAEDEFDFLALEVFLSIYRPKYQVQGANLTLMREFRDPVQDALADWLLAEEMNDADRIVRARSRFLRWAFSGDNFCDLATSTVVNFQASAHEIDSTFDAWNSIGVGQESSFRLLTFLTGASRAENRRRWRSVAHPCKKEGSFQFPNGGAGEEVACVFERLMGRGVLMGLNAVDLMRILPVVAVLAFLIAGIPFDESRIGCMTGLLEKKYRRCFEEIRVRSLSSESLVGSPQRVMVEESPCAIGCG